MKIVKYLLLTALLLILYITAPMWMVSHGPDVPGKIGKEQSEQKIQLSEEEQELIELERKFGPKPFVTYQSRVPKPVELYWGKMLKSGESIYDDICSPLKPTDKGWTTTCQYKIKSASGSSGLLFDTYTIKNGKLVP